MGRVVAIAGGDLKSTKQLNVHALKLSRKTNPNVLFIGTASNDAEEYISVIKKEYNLLGCTIKSLCLVSELYQDTDIDELLSWADVIYVGGGDTISMMNIWKRYKLDEKLKRIYERDLAVLTGISAGAICWFTCGHSDSESFENENNWKYCWADGMLDLFHMAFCPHYNEEGRDSFDDMLMEKEMDGLAMENDTAFVEDNGDQYFLRSDCLAHAYRMAYVDGQIIKTEVTFRE